MYTKEEALKRYHGRFNEYGESGFGSCSCECEMRWENVEKWISQELERAYGAGTEHLVQMDAYGNKKVICTNCQMQSLDTESKDGSKEEEKLEH